MDESNPIGTPPPTPRLGRPGGGRKRGQPKRRFTRGKRQRASKISNQRQQQQETESSSELDGLVGAPDMSGTQPHRELRAQQMSNPPIDYNFINNARIEVIEQPEQLHLFKGKVLLPPFQKDGYTLLRKLYLKTPDDYRDSNHTI